MNIVEAIAESWGWTGIVPFEVISENDFGNLIVKDIDGRYWRICPEDMYCKRIAGSHDEFIAINKNEEFLFDWNMSALVSLAYDKFGALTEGQKYCLKMPAILGGTYESSNFGTITLFELIRASGDIAQQIDCLPDGTAFEIVIN
jgi:hypothetical protein